MRAIAVLALTLSMVAVGSAAADQADGSVPVRFEGAGQLDAAAALLTHLPQSSSPTLGDAAALEGVIWWAADDEPQGRTETFHAGRSSLRIDPDSLFVVSFPGGPSWGPATLRAGDNPVATSARAPNPDSFQFVSAPPTRALLLVPESTTLWNAPFTLTLLHGNLTILPDSTGLSQTHRAGIWQAYLGAGPTSVDLNRPLGHERTLQSVSLTIEEGTLRIPSDGAFIGDYWAGAASKSPPDSPAGHWRHDALPDSILLRADARLPSTFVEFDEGVVHLEQGPSETRLRSAGPRQLESAPLDAQSRSAIAGAYAAAAGTQDALVLGAMLSGIAAIAWRRRNAFAFLAWLLPARLSQDMADQHPTRKRILERIANDPGVLEHQLRASVGGAWGTFLFHVGVLLRAKRIESVRVHRHRAYFLHAKYAPDDQRALAVIHAPSGQLLRYFQKHPILRPHQIAVRSGFSSGTVTWHLRRLERAGLVRVEQGRGSRRYELTLRAQRLLPPVSPP